MFRNKEKPQPMLVSQLSFDFLEAACDCSIEKMKTILLAGMNVNEELADGYRGSALHVVAKSRNTTEEKRAAIDFLINEGADPDQFDACNNQFSDYLEEPELVGNYRADIKPARI